MPSAIVARPLQRSLQESITSLEAGFVTNVNYDELVVATYSGKLISFSSEPSTGEAGEAGLRERSTTAHTSDASRKEAKEKGDKKIRALRTELEGLRQKVDRAILAQFGAIILSPPILLRSTASARSTRRCRSRSSAPRCSSR